MFPVIIDKFSCTSNKTKYFKGRYMYFISEKLKITNMICEPQVCTIDM